MPQLLLLGNFEPGIRIFSEQPEAKLKIWVADKLTPKSTTFPPITKLEWLPNILSKRFEGLKAYISSAWFYLIIFGI